MARRERAGQYHQHRRRFPSRHAGIAHTCAARGGVVFLSKTLAIEWAPLNIRIFITGEVLAIDGGQHIWGDAWTIPRPDWFSESGG